MPLIIISKVVDTDLHAFVIIDLIHFHRVIQELNGLRLVHGDLVVCCDIDILQPVIVKVTDLDDLDDLISISISYRYERIKTDLCVNASYRQIQPCYTFITECWSVIRILEKHESVFSHDVRRYYRWLVCPNLACRLFILWYIPLPDKYLLVRIG